jgi:hypothetical protein
VPTRTFGTSCRANLKLRHYRRDKGKTRWRLGAGYRRARLSALWLAAEPSGRRGRSRRPPWPPDRGLAEIDRRRQLGQQRHSASESSSGMGLSEWREGRSTDHNPESEHSGDAAIIASSSVLAFSLGQRWGVTPHTKARWAWPGCRWPPAVSGHLVVASVLTRAKVAAA